MSPRVGRNTKQQAKQQPNPPTNASVNGDPESQRLLAAHNYLERDWHTIPIPGKSKAPTLKRWQELRIEGTELGRQFAGEGNIGVLLGEPSGGLIDIDLDCPEANAMADAFLPPTQSVFGRESKPKSHRLYRVSSGIKSAAFKDIDGSMLVEIRSTGAQTVAPPSVHPSGESVEWCEEGEPTAISDQSLRKTVGQLAAAALLVRHYPEKGSRNELSICAANLLARASYDEVEISNFLVTVADAAGDEEAKERGKAARYAIERLASGAPTYGMPHLAEILNERVAKRFCEFLGLGYSKPGKASQSETGFKAAIQAARLWHVPEGRSYATITVNGHTEHWPVKSARFRNFLRPIIMAETGKMPTRAILDEVVDIADGTAQVGPAYDVFLRCVAHDGKIFVDLVNDRWEVIEISVDGWRTVTNPPVRFRPQPWHASIASSHRGWRLSGLAATFQCCRR